MKAPLIAVISVGIAAIAPAVAISASEPNQAQAEPVTQDVTSAPVPATDPREPIKAVGFDQNTKASKKQQKLVKQYLKLRKRANRLIAKRDNRRARRVREAEQIKWSTRALGREIRRLRNLVPRIRWDIKARRAGLTPSVQANLDRIAQCESGGNPRAIGGGGTFRGKYQFMFSTWRSVGGTGDPAQAPEREQDLRAAILLKRSGSSPWPVCG